MSVKGNSFDLVNLMKIKAIKWGQTIKLLEPINISDGEIIIDIDEQMNSRAAMLNQLFGKRCKSFTKRPI
jgi:hypothetical protein